MFSLKTVTFYCKKDFTTLQIIINPTCGLLCFLSY